jgi:hypothetical protein
VSTSGYLVYVCVRRETHFSSCKTLELALPQFYSLLVAKHVICAALSAARFFINSHATQEIAHFADFALCELLEFLWRTRTLKI